MIENFETRFKRYPFLADGLALAAGAVTPLGLSPFNLWPLGFVGLVVLVLLVDKASVRRGAFRFYLFAVGMYGVGASWIYISVHEYGNASAFFAAFLVTLLVLSWSLLSLIHGWLYMRFVRPMAYGLVLGFAVAWYLREWALTWVLTGFPWLYVGYGYLDTPLSGLVPVIGVTGLGFVITLVAGIVAFAIRKRDAAAVAFAVIAITVTGVSGFFLARISFVEPTNQSLEVSVVQGNIDQAIKWRRDMVGTIVETYSDLTESEWGRDLILWPEASITVFRESAFGLLDNWDRRGETSGTTLVLGIPDRSPEGRFLNTAIAVGEGEGRYIKRRLVPFGEYVPLEGFLRGLIGIFDLPMARNQSGPWEQPPIRVRDHQVSLSICYEVIYPEIVRKTTTGSPDFFITISNDAWFGDSIGPWQHLQMARARALENGRYMVRGTNNGITAIIDETGHMEGRLPQFEAGVLRGEIRLFRGTTPYADWGSLPVLILVMIILGMMVGARVFGAPANVSGSPIR